MNFKKIIFPFISLFLAKLVYDLLGYLMRTEPENYHILFKFFLAVLINLFVTGIFAFLGFAYPTHKVLPSNYYRITSAARLSFWYRILGVKYFRIVLMGAYWGRAKNRKKYFNGSRTGLKNLIFQSKQSEFGHIGAFVLITLIIIGLFYFDYYWLCLIVIVINFIGNIYPVLLQRTHRLRIDKLDIKQ